MIRTPRVLAALLPPLLLASACTLAALPADPVVSFGNGCARPHRYGIYTRVSSLAQWIDNTIRVIPAHAGWR